MTWEDDGPVLVEPIEPFTHMQGMCVALLVHDKDFSEIAKHLLISPLTVKDHIEKAAAKIPGDLPPMLKILVWARGATLDVLTGDHLRRSLAYQREQERFRRTLAGLEPSGVVPRGVRGGL